MSEYTPNLNLFKYNTSTDGKEVFSIAQALNHNWDILDNLGSGRNIGEIVASTLPLEDAGLHLLDGALIDGSGIYSEFVQYIVNLYTNNPTANYFTDETTWQDTVTNYGVCGKFVYDSTNNTVRLPKVIGIIEGTTDVTALGDLVQAGLPNITGKITTNPNPFYNSRLTVSGALLNTTTTSNTAQGSASGYTGSGVALDASRSNPIYGNSATVQPQTIKILYYIVIATSTKTDIVVDIDEVVTDLNGKVDTDLTNATNSAKVMMSGMAMPSDTYIDLTLGSAKTTYTAPANGWFVIRKVATAAGQFLYMGNIPTSGHTTICWSRRAVNEQDIFEGFLPVKKNDVVQIDYSLGGSTDIFRFTYAVGSESEAN